jgi:hypothetical protein
MCKVEQDACQPETIRNLFESFLSLLWQFHEINTVSLGGQDV